MDKEKVKEKMGVWKKRLAFLKPWNMDEEDQDDDLEIRSMQANDTSREAREESPEFIWFKGKNGKIYLAGGIAALVLLVAGGFWYYSGHHLFTEYVVTSTAESLDIAGTQYAMLGDSVIKYSPDGVFCVDSHNTSKWSVAYSMQSPIIDICKNTMVVAEQQGNQVYVMNEKGPMGNFETDLPVLKACVSAQGVVALVQEDDPVTWVNLYDCNGTKLAGVKTTMEDSGYPLDAAITENGEKLMVSFLGVAQGELKGRIAFYDFSSGLANGDNCLTGILDYPGQIFPEVYFADSSTPVGLWDHGFAVFGDGESLEEKRSVSFESEIVSSFHDEEYVGFVFHNEAEDCRYRMELYRYSGRRSMEQEFDCDYQEVKMDSGKILLYDAKNCTVYSTSGAQNFATDYEKQVEYFGKVPGYRRYLVITNDSMDRIRIS